MVDDQGFAVMMVEGNLVVFVRGFNSEVEGCGLGWIDEDVLSS